MIKLTPEALHKAAILFIQHGEISRQMLNENGIHIQADTKQQIRIREEAGRVGSRLIRTIPKVTEEYRGEYR